MTEQADQDPPAEAAPEGEDDIRAKYRAALDRKNRAAHGQGSGQAGDESTGKAHGPHGAAGGKREFRRKSG